MEAYTVYEVKLKRRVKNRSFKLSVKFSLIRFLVPFHFDLGAKSITMRFIIGRQIVKIGTNVKIGSNKEVTGRHEVRTPFKKQAYVTL